MSSLLLRNVSGKGKIAVFCMERSEIMVEQQQRAQLAGLFARFGRPVAIVDLETTGGHLYEDRITEIAILRFENGIFTRHQWLVNPQMPISPFISRLTGIDNEMVADAPTFAELAPQVLPLLQGSLLLAHNSRFDYTFLRHAFQRAGLAFAAPALCTVQLSRRLYPQFYKHNLDSLIERCGIEVSDRHRAMADVLALADFLEYALNEHGSDMLETQIRALMNPKMLPDDLPEFLATQLYALPDSCGILLWLDKQGRLLHMDAAEKMFSQTAEVLQKKQLPLFLQEAVSVEFRAAIGPLHMLWLKAQLAEQYGWQARQTLRSYLTVQFRENARGALQAKIVPLAAGSHDQRPNGLFLHKKSLRRALGEWSSQHGFCPAVLDILPSGHAKGEPCPVRQVGKCDGVCQSESGVAAQNQLVRQYAGVLPVADWGSAHEVSIVETDTLSGQSVTLRCAGGALALPDGRWYFDEALPAVLKAKFKQGHAAVTVLS